MKTTVKLYSDGAYRWQKEAHETIDKNKGKLIVIKAARQIYGKTHFCIVELVRTCLSESNLECAYISPTLQLAKENYDRIVQKLSPVLKSYNGSTKKLTFLNGSRISFFSAEQQDSLRGFHCSGLLVVDECAFIQDKVWNELVAAWTLVHKPTVIFISTPLFKDGFFWNAFNSKKNVVLDWTTTYPLPETDFLLEQKKNMPLRKYNCEYRGQWLEAEGAVFANFSDILIPPQKSDDALYVGIDWASGSDGDETVLAGFNNHLEMKLLRRWKNTNPTRQVEEIVALLKTLRIIKITAEENSIGKIYLDMLRKNFQVIGFNTTNDSKRKIIDNLRTHIEQKNIKLIDDPELVKQLSFYEEQKTSTGKITYNAKNGKHDDIVMATAIALWSTKTGTILKWI